MSRAAVPLALVVSLAALSPATASADGGAPATAEIVARVAARIAASTANRVRRAIAFGPHVGTYAGTSFGPASELVGGVSFGVAVFTFHSPSTTELIRTEVERAVRAELARVIAAGGTPDMDAIATKVYDGVKDALTGRARPRTLEKPALGVILEGLAQLEPSSARGARLGVTYGIGRVSVGVGGAFQRGGGNTIGYAGPDVSLRLTPWGRQRTPVIDLHLRFDVGFDEGDRPYLITIGGRLLLDLI